MLMVEATALDHQLNQNARLRKVSDQQGMPVTQAAIFYTHSKLMKFYCILNAAQILLHVYFTVHEILFSVYSQSL